MAQLDTITLTTVHAASNYGKPVLVIDGMAYGPADMTPAGITAAELARAWVERFEAQRQIVRVTTPLSQDLADGLQEMADQYTNGNRSEMARRIIRKWLSEHGVGSTTTV